MKVKEPLTVERKKLHKGQILFGYLHLAPDRAQTDDLLQSGVTAIAYETVTGPQGTLPLLTPMSEVAGRMAPHVGARCLEKENGGRGVLLGGVPGVSPASVVILGGGVAGTNAALIASGMGADVVVLDRTRRHCAASRRNSTAACAHFFRRGTSSNCFAGAPTWSSPRFWYRAPWRRN